MNSVSSGVSGMERPVVLSGIQPSGVPTLGNLLGSLKYWSDFQRRFRCFFMLADMHTITVRQDPKAYRQACYDLLALFLASGVDPQASNVFLQSQVVEHTQLAWLLTCHTYMGELQRMTQYKDKKQKHQDNINAGLFTYPVLMAADILLYQAQLVPVGADQKQHLEITRDLAERFNSCYCTNGQPVFTVPEGFIPDAGGRIMSLQNPTAKMSKSDSNMDGTILFSDTPEQISSKIKRAVTDAECSVRFDPVNKPGISNLLTILAAVDNESADDGSGANRDGDSSSGSDSVSDKIAWLQTQCQGMNYGQFKSLVAEKVVAFMRPMQEKFAQLHQNYALLDQILAQGRVQAQSCARITLQRAFEAMGFILPNS